MVVERWLIKAEHDLRSARNDLNDVPPLTDTACFHAQQCVEKALKAYLAFKDEHIEKTHLLYILLNRCAKIDKEFLKFADIAESLSKYAVTTRYPDDWRDIPVEEAEAAVKSASEVLSFVRSKIVD